MEQPATEDSITRQHEPMACPDSDDGRHQTGDCYIELSNHQGEIWVQCVYCGTQVHLGAVFIPPDWHGATSN